MHDQISGAGRLESLEVFELKPPSLQDRDLKPDLLPMTPSLHRYLED